MFIMIKSSVSPDHQSVFASNDGRTVAWWNVESGVTIPPYHQLKILLGTVLKKQGGANTVFVTRATRTSFFF
jgi:hypothetical protein